MFGGLMNSKYFFGNVNRASDWYNLKEAVLLTVVMVVASLEGCTGATTFPTVARPNDTVSVMVGGSETARKNTVAVTLTDANNVWDLQELGLVRSVFNLRPDYRANGMHYSSNFFDVENAWNKGHEPVQTVLVFDVPDGVAVGQAELNVTLNATDDSSGVASPFVIPIEIISGTGSSTNFLRQNFNGVPEPVNFSELEAAPSAKISFGKGGLGNNGNLTVGAASVTVSFDPNVVNGNDLNVVSSASTVRGTSNDPTASFGDKQVSMFWHQDGTKVYINVIAPEGVASRYIQLYIVHPRTVVGNPAFHIDSATFYDINGGEVFYSGIPVLSYNP